MSDVLFSSCDLGATKPEVEFFRRAAERLQRPPGSLLLVDDSAANVDAARSQGWNAVLYASRADLEAVSDWVGVSPCLRSGVEGGTENP